VFRSVPACRLGISITSTDISRILNEAIDLIVADATYAIQRPMFPDFALFLLESDADGRAILRLNLPKLLYSWGPAGTAAGNSDPSWESLPLAARKPSRMAVAAGTSPISLPQSASARLAPTMQRHETQSWHQANCFLIPSCSSSPS
jgi:hypothetical protein